MTRIMLLATAMAFLPLSALASSTETDQARAGTSGPWRPCTPYNPCAVPTPALGAPAAPLAAPEPAAAKAGQSAQLQSGREDGDAEL